MVCTAAVDLQNRFNTVPSLVIDELQAVSGGNAAQDFQFLLKNLVRDEILRFVLGIGPTGLVRTKEDNKKYFKLTILMILHNIYSK